MPSQETPAIIISVRDYGEADRLVTFLTPERGRLSGVAKHARQSKKRFANCLEPLSRVTLFLSARARGDLEFLEKGEAVRSFPALRRDLARLGAASLLAELAAEMASPPEATAAIFATLETALTILDGGGPPDSLLPAVLLHLLKLGGYGLSLHHCRVCGQEPQPPLLISLAKGGVVCGACARSAPGPATSAHPSAHPPPKQATQTEHFRTVGISVESLGVWPPGLWRPGGDPDAGAFHQRGASRPLLRSA